MNHSEAGYLNYLHDRANGPAVTISHDENTGRTGFTTDRFDEWIVANDDWAFDLEEVC